MHYKMQQQHKLNLLTVARCSLYASYAISRNHQHAQQRRNHHTIWFRVRLNMMAHIPPHLVLAATSLISGAYKQS